MGFDLDNEELEATRKLHNCDKPFKKKADSDTTYCTNTTCEKKCWRHIDYWTFEKNERYIFMKYCHKYSG